MTDKSFLEKIGVKTLRPYKLNGRWVFDYDDKTYDMAPAGLTEAVLSPTIVGVDRLIALSAEIKNLNPEKGFNLLFSEEYFPACDVKITFVENRFDGWLYNMTGENAKVADNQQVWLCPYLNLYFEKPPQQLYLKVENNEENS